jgi:predicted dehydrogenase
LGTQGSIIVEANKRILVKKQNDTEVEETIEEDTSYSNEFEDFYQAIRNGKEVVSSFSKAYEDLYVLLTALDSANQFHDLGTRE